MKHKSLVVMLLLQLITIDLQAGNPFDPKAMLEEMRNEERVDLMLSSFKHKYHILPKIDSPNGLYFVSNNGIGIIVVSGVKDKDGDYKVNIYSKKSSHSLIKENDKLYTGWWYPADQQFNLQHWERWPDTPHCNGWARKNWTYLFTPALLNVASKKIKLYKQVHLYTKNNKPIRYCLGYEMNYRTCKLYKCLKWHTPKPDAFLVKSESEALSLYGKLGR